MYWTDAAFTLGNEVMLGLGLAAYAVTMEVENKQLVTLMGCPRWLNLPHAVREDLVTTSHSPIVALKKAGELMATRPIIVGNEIVVTPCIHDKRFGCMQWRGGVRVGRRIVAISGMPQEHDELIAAVMHTGGMPNLRPEFCGVEMHNYRDGEVPVISLKTPNPDSLMEFVSKVCRVWIERVDGRQILYVEKGGDDERQPSIIGLEAHAA